jgi:hypothetical protein
MGIFRFLKRSSKEEEEVKEFSLDRLDLFIDSLSEKTVASINLRIGEIKESVAKEKEEMIENIQKLSEAKIKNPNIMERAKQMAEGNRKLYIQKINIFLRGVNLPNSFDESLSFCDSFDTSLEIFERVTIRSYKILPEFFAEEINKVSRNIKNLRELYIEVRKLVEDAEMEKYSYLKKKVSEIQEKIEEKKNTEEKIKQVEIELQVQTKKIDEKKDKIKALETSVEYKRFLELTDKKKALRLEIGEVEKGPLHYFFVIEPALKKYERLILDYTLIRAYLADPLKTLMEDKELKILKIVSKMKDSILKEQFELKEQKKKKILKELAEFGRSNFEMFLSRHAELSKELSGVDFELGKVTIVGKLENIRGEFNRDKSALEGDRGKLIGMKEELEDIDIDKLKKTLGVEVKDNVNENVLVK